MTGQGSPFQILDSNAGTGFMTVSDQGAQSRDRFAATLAGTSAGTTGGGDWREP